MTDKTPLDYQWDGYAKVACDVPYDSELEAMNDKQLDFEIERSKDGSARRSALQRERNRRDREVGTHVFPVPPDEKFRQVKEVGRWLKEHVLAGAIIVILTTILSIFVTRWLPSSQDQNRLPTAEPSPPKSTKAASP